MRLPNNAENWTANTRHFWQKNQLKSKRKMEFWERMAHTVWAIRYGATNLKKQTFS